MTSVCIVAPTLLWEEQRIRQRLRDRGVKVLWRDDGRFSSQSYESEDLAGLFLIRSRSYVRGSLLAGVIEDSGGVALNGSAAIRYCEDKYQSLRLCRQVGVACPDSRLVLTREDLHAALQQIGTPLVLKPLFGGSGRRVTLIENGRIADSVYDFIDDHAQSHASVMLAQEFVSATTSRVFVLGDKVIAAAEYVPPTNDWRSNAAAGGTAKPLIIDSELEESSSRLISLLGEGIFTFDFSGDKGSRQVLDLNHSPRFRAISASLDVDIAAQIADYVLGLGTTG